METNKTETLTEKYRRVRANPDKKRKRREQKLARRRSRK